MNLNDYQKEALVTALWSGDNLKDLAHWVLGISGEAGEVAEKVKKIIRDKNGELTQESKIELMKELGDVMWYIAVMAEHMGYSLEEVAQANITKLRDRQKRDVIKGSGDNR
jgi:NTP pyrophosphatase (non-canonical NTP hydrolase)